MDGGVIDKKLNVEVLNGLNWLKIVQSIDWCWWWIRVLVWINFGMGENRTTARFGLSLMAVSVTVNNNLFKHRGFG